VLTLVAGGSAIFLAWFAFGRRRRIDPVPTAYAKALRLLARRGLVRRSATTARAFASEVRQRCTPKVADAFDGLTERYLAERFGHGTLLANDVDLERLRAALRASP